MTEIKKPIIKIRDVIIDNKIYKVKELAFNGGSLFGIGKFFTETKKDFNILFNRSDNLEEGVYIYQDYNNPNIGYRIYKEFANRGFNGELDDLLVAKLKEKQKFIKKSKFPTGIITLDGRIVGQEIPLFLNHSEIHLYNNNNPVYIYKQVIDILKEMYDQNIGYLDGHCKNFVVEKNSGHVEIIDFEYRQMEFKTINCANYKIFTNLNNLIKCCNKNYGIDKILPTANIKNFDEAYKYVAEAEKELIKINRGLVNY